MIAKLDKTTWRSFVVLGIAALLLTWSPREHVLPADTPWHLLMQQDVSELTALPDTLRSLEGQTIMLTGFMYPLEASRGQNRFLLSPYSPSCPFHEHGGPVYTVEVFAEESLPYTFDPVAVSGMFALEAIEGNVVFQLHNATVENLP